ncbi:hypothetical protein SDC9_142759 [bioreactor metagenome]|uniref:Uncharacterized protein n=1 Tax=bioreactor metagenome TaxID=1076179 RepID=A0A645E1D8_9ZZZZ
MLFVERMFVVYMMRHIIEQYIHVLCMCICHQFFEFIIGAETEIDFRRRYGPVAVVAREFCFHRFVPTVRLGRVLVEGRNPQSIET